VAANLGFDVGHRTMPWQWWTLRKICSRLPADGDGIALWTHPDCVLAIPRQNGKTEIAILRIPVRAVRPRRDGHLLGAACRSAKQLAAVIDQLLPV
jgi:hypothetical protein